MRWIIGDIHGMLGPLQALLEEVLRADPQARFLFAGDYVNRGPDSRGVIDLLLKMPQAQCIRGNHDDIFDLVVNGAAYAENAAEGSRLIAFQWFLEHGLDTTFLSYGVEIGQLKELRKHPSDRGLEQIIAAVPQAHRDFIRGLTTAIHEEEFFVVHAKWDLNQPDEQSLMDQRLTIDLISRHKVLWGRYTEAEIQQPKPWSRTGYFGHTPVYAYAAAQRRGQLEMLPIVGPKMVLLDTGLALSATGRLTAFCPDQHIFIQTDHFGKVIEA